MEDGIACVIDADGQPRNEFAGPASVTAVPPELVEQALAAALSCPGECIYLEEIGTT
jgi:ferredoxin